MKIAALVSGGVDSSVALALLREAGHDVTAFYLKIWLEDDLAFLGDCPWEEDLRYVRAICQQLDVPLKILPLQRDYWDTVVAYTISELKAGHTPSPDIMCNQQVKFGIFYDKIDAQFERVATGHYARIERDADGTAHLLCAIDPVKDQTYFLSGLSQRQLARAMFPIGDTPKSEVRALAQRLALPTAQRKDSQGICFLGTIRFADFVKYHLGEQTGDLIEYESGQKLGEHQGYWYYTIGQRQGIGLHGGPWYVVARDIQKNIVYISNHYHDTDKRRDHCTVYRLSWISGYAPALGEPTALRIKVRHGARTYDATVTFSAAGLADVQLDQSDQGLAAGQFCVFYDGERCLGHGMIRDDAV